MARTADPSNTGRGAKASFAVLEARSEQPIETFVGVWGRHLPAAALAAVLGMSACTKDGDEHAPGADGRAMFERYCAACHGSSGNGNFLKGVPPNRDTVLGVSEIADRILTRGSGHRKMPTFPKLTRSEALAIAHYVKQLKDPRGGQGAFWEVPPVGPRPDRP